VGVDTFRRAATYVDRILRGEKPGDLPVQTRLVTRRPSKILTSRSFNLSYLPALSMPQRWLVQ
jgi:putative ABC transport system substrate-binding protein